MESRELAKQICEALADKKGEDIRVIDIHGVYLRSYCTC